MINIPNIPGSFEDTTQKIQKAIAAKYYEGREYGPFHVLGVLPDSVVVSVKINKKTGDLLKSYGEYPSGNIESACEERFLRIPYTVENDGEVTLGEGTPVEFQLTDLDEAMSLVMAEGVLTVSSFLTENSTLNEFFDNLTQSFKELR